MSKPMTKKTKILLGVLCALVALGICFTAIGFYAKNEIEKPRFQMPEETPQASVTQLPADGAQAAAYVQRLFAAALAADDVELSLHTDVDLGGDATLPFADADNDLLLYIRDQAGGQIAALYPTFSNTVMRNEADKPQLPLPANVLEYTSEQGHTDENGEVTDDQYYFITMTLDPAAIDTQAMLASDVFRGVGEILAPAAAVDKAEITPQTLTLSAKIDRVTDQLLTVDVTRGCQIDAAVTLSDAYAALSAEKAAQVTLPYQTTEHFSFFYYGARFTERAIVVKANDMKQLPAAVNVNADTTKDDYKLTFEVSHPDMLSVDADGVLSVAKKIEPVTATVKMTLAYDGHTYEDTLTVYITDLEVETNA
ncbi:MAG: hypothetical protein IK080_04190 [Clostridia bacterium]|nr:hypothetical protein [Clostridia bacterium]